MSSVQNPCWLGIWAYIYIHAYTLSNILAMITIHYGQSDLPANIKGPAEGIDHSFEHCSYPQLRAFFTC
jgi:hypothetical protein